MTTSGTTIPKTLADANLQLAIYTSTGRLMQKRRSSIAEDLLPDFQELRNEANRLKQHTINNLDYYLESSNATLRRMEAASSIASQPPMWPTLYSIWRKSAERD